MGEGETARSGGVASAWNWYASRVTTLGTALSLGLGRLSGFIYRRTKLTVVASVLLLLVCSIGWLRFKIVSDGDKLWNPQHSKTMKDGKYVKANFGSVRDSSMLIVSANSGSYGNVISLETTWEIFKLDQKIRALKISKGGKQYGFSDICFRDEDGGCRQYGYLNFWNMSFPQYLKSVGGSETKPNVGNLTQLMADVNALQFPDGQSVSTLSIFGGVKLSSNPVRLTGSRAIMVEYRVDREVSKAVADKWMNKFLKMMKNEQKSFKSARVDYFSGGLSIDNEISASVNKDLYLVAIAILIFIVVSVICLSKRDKVKTRSSLAVIGLLSAVLAMLAGYGLSMAIGLPFTTLQQTLPFILLGVSVDVMIILTATFDDIALSNPSLTSAERFAHLMKTAGTSVFVTTFASALAFALGTITELPAIQYFSAFATLSVVCIFISQVTFFLGVFIMTERRIAAHRVDCCCCFTAAGASKPADTVFTAVVGPNDPPALKSMAAAPAAGPVSVKAAVDSSASANTHSSVISKFFDKYYAPFLLKLPVRVIVVLLFIGFAAFSGWAYTELKEGQPLEELAPDDSYLVPFIKINKATFDDQLGPSTSLLFRGLDVSSPSVQAKMLRALNTTLTTNSYFNITISAFQDNWLMSFINYAAARNVTLDTTAGCFNPYTSALAEEKSPFTVFLDPQPLPGCVPKEQFYPVLTQFLADKRFKSFANDIKFNPDGSVKVSAFSLFHRASKQKDDFDRKMLKAVRESESDVNDNIFKEEHKKANKGDVFLIYTSQYNNGEGLAILPLEMLIYVIMAVAGVGIVMLLMLVHPLAALLMMISVALVDLFLFGEMYIFSIRFNYVSVINMIMATGLAVDYSVYLAYKFMTTEGEDRVTRMHIALKETGSAVFLGALTSLAGTIPLAFSSSTILRTFFALLFGTVVFATLSGMVLMPALFATIGPAALGRAEEKKESGGSGESPV